MTAETAKMASGEILEGEVVKKTRNQYRGGSRSSLAPDAQFALMREVALKTDTYKNLGLRYNLTPSAISEFAKRHAREIDDIREDASNIFSGLMMAKKENRIAAYEREIEMLASSSAHDHHEWSKARMIALRNIAEEMGQLPPRQTVTVMPVVHVYEGVDMEEL